MADGPPIGIWYGEFHRYDFFELPQDGAER